MEIKALMQQKRYGARKFIAKFPKKTWDCVWLIYHTQKIDATGSVEKRQGSGTKCTVR